MKRAEFIQRMDDCLYYFSGEYELSSRFTCCQLAWAFKNKDDCVFVDEVPVVKLYVRYFSTELLEDFVIGMGSTIFHRNQADRFFHLAMFKEFMLSEKLYEDL